MEQLVEQAKIGDRQALNTLYFRYRQRSYAVCRHITHDNELSEELVDDAFLVAFSKLDYLNDPNKFGKWISTISARLALRQLKRQSENKTIPFSSIEGFDVAGEFCEPPLTSEELQEALDQLPNGYRQVFTLSVIEGKSHKEIAQTLNIEPHSSSSQLCHAKAMLRRIIGPLLCVLILVTMQDRSSDQCQPIQADARVPKWVDGKESAPSETQVCDNQLPVWEADSQAMPIFSQPDISEVYPVASQQCDTAAATMPPMPIGEMVISYEELRHPQPLLLAEHSLSRWSVMVSASHPLSGEGSIQRSHSLLLPSVSAASSLEQGVVVSNWRECKQYVLENSKLFSDEVAAALIRIAQSNEMDNDGEIVRIEHHEPPVVATLAIQYAINNVFSVYTGIGHGEYRSYFQTGVGRDRIDEYQRIAFLDIPLGVSYGLTLAPQLGCYFSADLSLQLPLALHSSTTFVLDGQSNGMLEIPLFEQSSHACSPSLTSAIKTGMQYRLTEHIGLVAEGGVRYTVVSPNTEPTYATVRPLVFSTQIGLCFTF